MNDDLDKREDNNDEISETRKALYYIGMALTVIGFLMFFSVFLQGLGGYGAPNMSAAPIGMIMIIIGQLLGSVGKKGLSGSGIKLDPKEARKDLEPFSRQGGGIMADAVDEFRSVSKSDPLNEKTVIKVKCRNCGALNDEDANFCDNCGEKL